METRKCIECNNDFEIKNNSGHEQKYCSKNCRYKSANKRRESNLVEKLKGQIQPQTIIGNERTETERPGQSNFSSNGFKLFDVSSDRILQMVSENAYLKSENIRLEEKVKTLEIDYNRLESEFNDLEEEIENKQMGNNSMMGEVNTFVDKISPFVPYVFSIFANKPNNDAKTKTA